MKLSIETLFQLKQIAVTAATQAGQLIASYADKKISAQLKTGGDSQASQVVTEVDFKSQDVLLNLINPTCAIFDLALLTEELPDDKQRLTKDYFWCIDPLDGTLPFVEGIPGYAVSIALVSRTGVPQLGIVYDPVTKTLYHAILKQGAFRNDKPWQPTTLNKTSPQILTFHSDRSFLSEPHFGKVIDALNVIAKNEGYKELKISQYGGGVMNAIWTLEKNPACYFKFPKTGNGGGSLWDYAATACITAEIGATASDIYGKPLDLNRPDSTYLNHKGILFASDQRLANQIIQMYTQLNICGE